MGARCVCLCVCVWGGGGGAGGMITCLFLVHPAIAAHEKMVNLCRLGHSYTIYDCSWTGTAKFAC